MSLTSTSIIAQTCSVDIEKSTPNSRFIASNNGTVKDLRSGLVWMRCPLGKSWDASSASCIGQRLGTQWQTALQDVADINSKPIHKLHKFAGYNNWRLPSAKELFSLIEKACIKPALNSKAFPNFTHSNDSPVSGTVWSSTAAGSGDVILVMDTDYGEILTQLPNKTGADYGVLLVTDDK